MPSLAVYHQLSTSLPKQIQRGWSVHQAWSSVHGQRSRDGCMGQARRYSSAPSCVCHQSIPGPLSCSSRIGLAPGLAKRGYRNIIKPDKYGKKVKVLGNTIPTKSQQRYNRHFPGSIFPGLSVFVLSSSSIDHNSPVRWAVKVTPSVYFWAACTRWCTDQHFRGCQNRFPLT